MDFCSDKLRTEDQTPQRYLKIAVMMVRMDEHGSEILYVYICFCLFECMCLKLWVVVLFKGFLKISSYDAVTKNSGSRTRRLDM